MLVADSIYLYACIFMYINIYFSIASRKFLCAMVSKGSEVRLGRGNPPGRMPGKSAKEN
jgi:hypothetical protein